MDHRAKALQTAKEVLASSNRAVISKLNYISYKKGQITAVHCRCCGCDIKRLIEDERPLRTRRQGNLTVVTKLAVLATLPNYREVTVQFDDGSTHVMNLCADCGKDLNLRTLEHMYAVDVLMMDRECSVLSLASFPWELWSTRKPKSWDEKLSQGFDQL